MSDTFIAKTSDGTFSVSVKEDIKLDFETRQPKTIGYLIKVGGKVPDCVFINVPIEGDIGHFVRLESKEGCLIEAPQTVGGEKTTTMAKLAITIAKEKNPNLQFLHLLDTASFSCKLPNREPYLVNSTEYELFFQQQAQYERRFNAHIINNNFRNLYEQSKKAFDDPSVKPDDFDFKHPELQEYLEPLFKKSKTWKEFADKIRKTYQGNKKCQVIYLWLKDALGDILGGTFASLKWTLEVTPENQVQQIRVKQGGRQTRKGKSHTWKMDPGPSEYLAIDFSSLKPKNIKNTTGNVSQSSSGN